MNACEIRSVDACRPVGRGLNSGAARVGSSGIFVIAALSSCILVCRCVTLLKLRQLAYYVSDVWWHSWVYILGRKGAGDILPIGTG